MPGLPVWGPGEGVEAELDLFPCAHARVVVDFLQQFGIVIITVNKAVKSLRNGGMHGLRERGVGTDRMEGDKLPSDEIGGLLDKVDLSLLAVPSEGVTVRRIAGGESKPGGRLVALGMNGVSKQACQQNADGDSPVYAHTCRGMCRAGGGW